MSRQTWRCRPPRRSPLSSAKPKASPPTAPAPLERRECAAGILGLDPSGKTARRLSKLLRPAEPDEVQIAAATALTNLPSADIAQVFIDRWRAATAKVRDVLSDAKIRAKVLQMAGDSDLHVEFQVACTFTSELEQTVSARGHSR